QSQLGTRMCTPGCPGRFAAVPQFVQMQVFAIRVHRKEEPFVLVRDELTFCRQSLQWFSLENARWIGAQIIEHATIEDEEASARPTVYLRFFGKSTNAA